ncbi:hypothetical protein TNCV_4666791 [Trichonephila clavipes]|nr:hypothetical protein TNCV_4666791 [Trichonephila clavipes]
MFVQQRITSLVKSTTCSTILTPKRLFRAYEKAVINFGQLNKKKRYLIWRERERERRVELTEASEATDSMITCFIEDKITKRIPTSLSHSSDPPHFAESQFTSKRKLEEK